jgi:GDPmannose 4,6-dehydratase
MVRRNSIAEHQESRIDHLVSSGQVKTEYGDLLDQGSIDRMMSTIRPDEVYNIAAQSHVRISFDIPQFTVQTNSMGVLNVLESFRKYVPKSRFYQASSSEMFGNSVDDDGFQRELTRMSPVSPYGCAKVFGYNIVRNYRHSYKMFATNGILFNHESPRRGSNFVTNKVVKAAVRIKLGLQDDLELGNMDSYRDWGHSWDYVRAMNLIINHSVPDDFVVSTGITHSIRDLCDYVFTELDMDYEKYVVQNQKFVRPEELEYLKGDSTRVREILGWKPKYTFETMLDDMINYWLGVYSD